MINIFTIFTTAISFVLADHQNISNDSPFHMINWSYISNTFFHTWYLQLTKYSCQFLFLPQTLVSSNILYIGKFLDFILVFEFWFLLQYEKVVSSSAMAKDKPKALLNIFFYFAITWCVESNISHWMVYIKNGAFQTVHVIGSRYLLNEVWTRFKTYHRICDRRTPVKVYPSSIMNIRIASNL